MQNAERLTGVHGERRSRKRFPIMAVVWYRVTSPRDMRKSGVGRTVDVSSRGVLFTAPEALAPGSKIELSVSWPARLDHKVALKMVSRGCVVRCEGTNVAVELSHSEFRTQTSAGFCPSHTFMPTGEVTDRVLSVHQH